MDLMKVFNKTVREIKREVNLKVLNVPEIEQKVLDATDDEPWGPHGTVLAEIAQATKKFSECQLVMNVLWTRLSEIGKNWRFIYKSLSVIEYLVANGSERALDDIIEHTYQISSLASFEYVELNGKDVGLNVRKKAETITGLLNNQDKIQQVRDKAASTREKYFGLSSSGITYKSGAASFGSSNFKSSESSDRYGGFGNAGNNETSYDSYKDKDKYGEDRYEKKTKSKKEPSGYNSKKQDSPATGEAGTSTKTSQVDKYASVSSKHDTSDKYDEDSDDFDPRGTLNSSKPSPGSNQADLFGPNVIDMFDAPVYVPNDNSTSLDKNPSEIDLFSEADFVSATPELEAGKSLVPQSNVDLFATQSTQAVSTPIDLFSGPDPVIQTNTESSKSDTTGNIFDPFSAIPLSNFDGSDLLGTLTSQTDPLPTISDKDSPDENSEGKTDGSMMEIKSPPKKDAFQVKSGIWADSLSCGLIDLNITAPKKVNLADIGIVGGLTDGSEQKDNGPSMPSFHMGSAMGAGSGTGKSAFTSTSTSDNFFSSLNSQPSTRDDFFSSLSSQPQHQYEGFQK